MVKVGYLVELEHLLNERPLALEVVLGAKPLNLLDQLLLSDLNDGGPREDASKKT